MGWSFRQSRRSIWLQRQDQQAILLLRRCDNKFGRKNKGSWPPLDDTYPGARTPSKLRTQYLGRTVRRGYRYVVRLLCHLQARKTELDLI